MKLRVSRVNCAALLLLCALVFICLLIFYQSESGDDYYIPKGMISDIKEAESNAVKLLKDKLRRTYPQRIVRQPIKHLYPRRQNMEPCKPLFGRVGIFVAVNTDHQKRFYKIAMASLQCYLKSTNYTFFLINTDTDERTKGLCNQQNFYYRRHCVASYYLKDVDWMLFLDGDIGVINPNHCIEEWIDDRVDMIFYERFFNWEIMAGSFLLKNTEQSRKFLVDLAETEKQQFEGFTGYDNGAMQLLVLKAALPGAKAEIKACDEIYHRGKTLQQYYNYVTCVKVQLAHAWARDSQLTGNHWSDNDFMFHAWKASELNSTWFDANVFTKIPDPEECGEGLKGWHWIPEKHASVEWIRNELASFEKGVASTYYKEARDLPHLVQPDVRECYPDCDKYT